MIPGDLDVPFCHTVTTVRLSQLKESFLAFLKKDSQVCTATLIVYNSFQAMLISCCSAPHSSDPEASVCNCYLSNENQGVKFFLTNEVKSLTAITGRILPLLSGEDGGAVL